jgi:hypothetical protein
MIGRSISRKKIRRKSAPSSKQRNSTKTKPMRRAFSKSSTTSKLPLRPRIRHTRPDPSSSRMTEKEPISGNRTGLNHPNHLPRTDHTKMKAKRGDMIVVNKTKETKSPSIKVKSQKDLTKTFLKVALKK